MRIRWDRPIQLGLPDATKSYGKNQYLSASINPLQDLKSGLYLLICNVTNEKTYTETFFVYIPSVEEFNTLESKDAGGFIYNDNSQIMAYAIQYVTYDFPFFTVELCSVDESTYISNATIYPIE